jgi:hypothetical protein
VRELKNLVQLQAMLAGREPAEELPQIRDHHVSARLPEGRGIAAAVHPDHQTEAAFSPCANACQRVLDDHSVRRRHVEPLRRLEELVGGGLASQVLLGDDLSVDDLVEQLADAAGFENGAAILAGRDDRRPDPACA